MSNNELQKTDLQILNVKYFYNELIVQLSNTQRMKLLFKIFRFNHNTQNGAVMINNINIKIEEIDRNLMLNILKIRNKLTLVPL